ncbi:hypothetical protein [Lactiplantibacillus paraplantarum]|uniref:hypothetical protein n=1 Tax=Lactiplantibacillus paraplantarum TaxID=60520 RepID=UPI003DA3D346
MSNAQYGFLIGLLLGIVWVLTSFSAVLLVAVLGLIGWTIGRFVHVDLAALSQKLSEYLSK